jgi:hypothetical protein
VTTKPANPLVGAFAILASTLLVTCLTSGCASPTRQARPVPSRDEIEVTQYEIDQLVRGLYRWQEKLTVKGEYSQEQERRDLSRVVTILRDAKEEIIAERERFREQHHISINEGEPSY